MLNFISLDVTRFDSRNSFVIEGVNSYADVSVTKVGIKATASARIDLGCDDCIAWNEDRGTAGARRDINIIYVDWTNGSINCIYQVSHVTWKIKDWIVCIPFTLI